MFVLVICLFKSHDYKLILVISFVIFCVLKKLPKKQFLDLYVDLMYII